MHFTPIIEKLPSTIPFLCPEAIERNTHSNIRARLGANESHYGASPKAISAMQKAAEHSWKYCDAENHELRQAIAATLGLPAHAIVCGGGIDGLLGTVARLFIAPGDVAVTSLGAYPTFNYHVAACGGRLVTTPYVNDREDPESLLRLARSEGAKLLYFCNPDNPMGSHWPAEDVQRLINAVPEDCLLLLDEAYIEFAPEGTAPVFDLSRRNVLRFRSFSKIHGLAGLRVGYAIGHPELVSGFDKIRDHFGISRISQAGAAAAITDQDWVRHVKAEVIKARKHISHIAAANGLTPLPSATNFIAIDCGRDGIYARAILDGLQRQGIFIRMPGVAPLNRCIRVSCAPQDTLELFAQALPDVLLGLD
jgi:histidinol-phosphate aminotransferase